MSKEFFKRIENPNQLRRKVLESSKLVIQNLKSYQKILDIRKEKLSSQKELKIQVKEINLLLDKIRDFFPIELLQEYDNEQKAKQPKSVKIKATKGKKKTVEIKKTIAEPSELTKLENKLADIEGKLKSLS